MARTIPHRELRNNSSKILREVQNGEIFNVTNHGEVVAVLMPPPAIKGPRPLKIRKAKRRGGFDKIESVKIEGTTQEILDYLRGER
ncbi:MAG: type II toxin-antitoxin system prevent-host-death family antitoxin [Solirubrobacterales bacterium]|nr:type II toxin-antitoxin system prevent-host-death family antitoxin [Solirubrobacterales bacterium]